MPDEFGGLDVGRILIPEGPALHAEDETEYLHMGGQIGKRKALVFPRIEVVELDTLEVTDQDVARPLALRQGVNIFPGLPIGSLEVAPGALLFNNEDARPEQVNKARPVIQLFHVLFVPGYGAAFDTENLEEIIVEALRLAFFVARGCPLTGKGCGSGAYFVPGQSHDVSLMAVRGSICQIDGTILIGENVTSEDPNFR